MTILFLQRKSEFLCRDKIEFSRMRYTSPWQLQPVLYRKSDRCSWLLRCTLTASFIKETLRDADAINFLNGDGVHYASTSLIGISYIYLYIQVTHSYESKSD